MRRRAQLRAPRGARGKGLTAQPLPGATALADGKAQRFVEGQKVGADWWRLLSCPELDAIVVQALARNPTLEAARATLRASQDTLKAGYGVFVPQASVGASVTREKYDPARESIPLRDQPVHPLFGVGQRQLRDRHLGR